MNPSASASPTTAPVDAAGTMMSPSDPRNADAETA